MAGCTQLVGQLNGFGCGAYLVAALHSVAEGVDELFVVFAEANEVVDLGRNEVQQGRVVVAFVYTASDPDDRPFSAFECVPGTVDVGGF